jgi:branched-chain amino acid aminotransferase
MSLSSLEHQGGFIWVDGRLVPWEEATLHVLSHGLNYASSVFEGERIYGGTVFKLVEHTERLLRSAELIGFELPYTVEQLCEATKRVVAAQGLRSGYVRPVAWKGSEELGIGATNAKTHVAIAAIGMGDPLPPELRKAGVRLKTSTWARPMPNMAPIRAKASCHYVISRLAIQEAKAAGCDDALMLDHLGDIAESTGSNFFAVMDGVVCTPAPEFALDGITRRTVMDLARAQGIEVKERVLRLGDLAMAQEAFLTGTAVEILPVRSVDGRDFPESRPVTELLTREYFKTVGKEA